MRRGGTYVQEGIRGVAERVEWYSERWAVADACKAIHGRVISHKEYNCRERGECYLTYRKRIARENEQYLQDRPNRQTIDEWYAEYDAAKKEGMGLFLRIRSRVHESVKQKV